jgi:uncharacterized protein (TIGR02246 family)
MAASKSGDLATVLSLMTDDVIFMVPGQEPFGKEAFAAAAKGMGSVQIEGSSEILELRVLGDWAFIRNRIEMKVTPPSANPMPIRIYAHPSAQGGQWQVAARTRCKPSGHTELEAEAADASQRFASPYLRRRICRHPRRSARARRGMRHGP